MMYPEQSNVGGVVTRAEPEMTLLDALALLLMSNPNQGRRPAEHSAAMRRAQEIIDAHAKTLIG